ncbi:hypothetical protein RQP53_05675 [Paucibacter sp. APW11]|uniref:MSHA biogenesis protein MshK n=1 Tax=Roseateles aquae TaxID=3077235 RepID=A0ABU3PAH9_9BURK|nr:hypothetical protein [Paucibacter sp. APW11]MDT8998756.1 hypothetical protein [Paucibacter sp. APW11]
MNRARSSKRRQLAASLLLSLIYCLQANAAAPAQPAPAAPAKLPTAPAAASAVAASGGRDPMQWPPALRAAAAAEALAAAGPASAAEAEAIAPRLLLFSDGKAYVMQGSRRLGIGDKLGEARIVRIDQQAVWLREAGVTRREPLFAGVELRPSPESDAAASAPAGKATKRKNNKSVSKEQP